MKPNKILALTLLSLGGLLMTVPAMAAQSDQGLLVAQNQDRDRIHAPVDRAPVQDADRTRDMDRLDATKDQDRDRLRDPSLSDQDKQQDRTKDQLHK